jgi:hypothetical protein
MILLPQLPECWDYSDVSPYLTPQVYLKVRLCCMSYINFLESLLFLKDISIYPYLLMDA